jgi:uncharacterized protein YbjT (DUF2867 family)
VDTVTQTQPDTVLVTGATGRVGTPLVSRLQDAPVTVRVATREPSAATAQFPDASEVVDFDLERPETWGQALADVDALFLLFPPAVGVAPVTRFVDAACRVGVKHVVYLSILGAEKLPIVPHRRIERHLDRAPVTTTYCRAGYFMQNLRTIHRPEIVERDELYVPAGRGELSFVDARDVAAVAATRLTAAPVDDRAFDLTGPEALDFRAVADVFAAVLDREITYADPSMLAFARHMYRRGVDPSLVAFMVVEYAVVRLGFSGRTTDDVADALGRPPRTMRAFVTDHAAEFATERATET